MVAVENKDSEAIRKNVFFIDLHFNNKNRYDKLGILIYEGMLLEILACEVYSLSQKQSHWT